MFVGFEFVLNSSELACAVLVEPAEHILGKHHLRPGEPQGVEQRRLADNPWWPSLHLASDHIAKGGHSVVRLGAMGHKLSPEGVTLRHGVGKAPMDGV